MATRKRGKPRESPNNPFRHGDKQAKFILLNVYKYFQAKSRSISKTIEATGVLQSLLKSEGRKIKACHHQLNAIKLLEKLWSLVTLKIYNTCEHVKITCMLYYSIYMLF